MRTLIKADYIPNYDLYFDDILNSKILVAKSKGILETMKNAKGKKAMSKRNPVHTEITNFEGEVWKPVVWNGGIYAKDFEVSNLGRVRNTADGSIVPSYYAETRKANQVHLGETTTPSVAHLVAESFVPNDFGFTKIVHLDGDYQNDRWDNLEWER